LATHFVLCEVRTESLYIMQIYICLNGIYVTLHIMVLIVIRPHRMYLHLSSVQSFYPLFIYFFYLFCYTL